MLEFPAANMSFDIRFYIIRYTHDYQEWRKIAGRKIKTKYGRYVELKNKKSRLNGYNDTGDDWRSQ